MAPRILVAEDETLAAIAIEDMLRDAGYDVLLASDGQQALEIAALNEIDLLLTDLRMPRLSGNELVRKLREGRPGLPVVVMTGYAPPGGVGALQSGYGPMVLLNKPLDPDELLESIRVLTGSRPG